jgi:hypothetical protein
MTKICTTISIKNIIQTRNHREEAMTTKELATKIRLFTIYSPNKDVMSIEFGNWFADKVEEFLSAELPSSSIRSEVEGKTYTIESKDVSKEIIRPTPRLYLDSLTTDSSWHPYIPYNWKLKSVPNYLLKKV